MTMARFVGDIFVKCEFATSTMHQTNGRKEEWEVGVGRGTREEGYKWREKDRNAGVKAGEYLVLNVL